VKLLRVLQEREFERLGGTRTLKVDVRLIAATNRDLRAALENGTFRQDLYYRLNVVPIDIAPLRERREDIPELVKLFIARFSESSGHAVTGVSPEVMRALVQYSWPGNVRELQNVMERACALATGSVLTTDDVKLDDGQRARSSAPADNFLPHGYTLEQWEDEMIREALNRSNGNKSQAARLLGLSRNALRYRLSKLGIADDADTPADEREGEADER